MLADTARVTNVRIIIIIIKLPTPVSRRQPCCKNNNAQKVHSTSQWPGLSECVNQTLMDSATKQHAYNNNFMQAHYDLFSQQLNILEKMTTS